MEIVNVLYNGPGQSSQNYSDRDLSLINSTYVNTTFGDPNDYVEAFISDEMGFILNYDYNLQSYFKTSEVNSGTNKFTSVLIDPQKDVTTKGFNRGTVVIQYNFLKNLFNSKYGVFYWIKDISPSRLELKLSSQQLSGDSMKSGFGAYQNYVSQKNYYSDFYLNFGENNLILAVNAAYVNDGTDNYILIKLYEPLPSDFDIKSQLWIVDKLAESVSFSVTTQVEAEQIDTTEKLRGANFKIEVAQKVGQTTPYYSYNNLFSAPISSSIRQLMSYYDDKAVSINVDYSNFNNFVHFSSATERVNNFAYKVGLIENYNKQIVSQSAIIGNSQVASIASGSIFTLQSSIDAIIEKFDTYEYYLYYESGAFAWPKSNSSKPYNLYSTTSSQAINWLGSTTTIPTATTTSILYSASLYDQTNKDLLSATIPQYLLDDPNNQPYVTFLDMIGQHFDNIWIYYKDVSNRFNATNNPNTGISLDLVSDALNGMGIELYTNTNLSDSVYYSLFGTNSNGINSFPTGSEKNINIVTSSLESLPYDQIQKEIYKRVYHNLPYLLKTRGTERGVKALIACYGIPDSILTVNEYGGTLIGGEDIFELNDTKINVISTNELSQSLLSPKSTIQKYTSNYRKNSLSVEVGFSPSDTINTNITSSLTYSIDQLIGNPALRYSSSYSTLDTYRESYFSGSYTKPHSVAEYIRLIKFYNNSLFKIIKDFVPARASVSTGIIIKPHVLERNKYARNEPSMSFQTHSGSIETAFITASAATSYTTDTTHFRIITSSLGYIQATESYGFEKYTGQYQGTKIIATDLNSVGDQTEISKNALTSSRFNFGAMYQNITASVRSQKYLDLDYGYNANVPVNFGIITQSINNAQINNYSTYTNKNNPYAELQDFNYFAQRSTIQRYYGSKVESLKYNTFSTSSANWIGDNSYGNTAAIDLKTSKLALFTQIFTSSFFPGEVNATIAYLVDNATGLFELNQLNSNWFEVQNTFKSGRTATIKLFDNKKYSNQKLTDGVKTIFQSGYRYTPILYASQVNDKKIYFNFDDVPDVSLLATNTLDPLANTNTSNRYISGSGAITPVYPMIPTGTRYSASIYNIFDQEQVDQVSSYTPGDYTLQTTASYAVTKPGDYLFQATLTISYEVSSSQESGSFTFLVGKNGASIISQSFTYNNTGTWPLSCCAGTNSLPTTVASVSNWRFSLYRNPSDATQIALISEYIGSDRILYAGDYLMPQGNYTSSVSIKLMKGTTTPDTYYVMPMSSSSGGYYSSNSWVTNITGYPVASSNQATSPTVTAGTQVLLTAKHYGSPVSPSNVNTNYQRAIVARGYVTLTAAGSSYLTSNVTFTSNLYVMPTPYTAGVTHNPKTPLCDPNGSC